jgi:hypothetical protein
VLKLFAMAVLAAASATTAAAQAPADAQPTQSTTQSAQTTQSTQTTPAASRQAAIEQEQAQKATATRPYVPNKTERWFNTLDTLLAGGQLKWHPFFESAYSGGGFTLGAGWLNYVSAYNTLDVRGSYTFSNYKRVEAEFAAPRLFNRRGHLSILGGWRDAPQVAFYGIGTNTSQDARLNYRFRQPYLSGLLKVFPTRRTLMLGGGAEYSRWSLDSGEGSVPSIDTVFTPETLPGLGAEVTYLHTQGAVGLDWRTSPGYTRRGAYIGATLHDYSDRDDAFGFQLAEYEGIAHLPILRETWALSFHGRVQTAFDKDDQQIPFFMLPALGGGSSLRGYPSWRFRDRNSLLLQAEWRIMVNRYLDMAFFYDAGKVVPRTSDLDLDGLKDDYGFGLRFHGPFATPLRVEIARSRESSFSFIFASSASF